MENQHRESVDDFMGEIARQVQCAHSHNITAIGKRLEEATATFLSAFPFDAHLDAAIRVSVADIGYKLDELRFAEDEQAEEKVRHNCYVSARYLYDVAQRLADHQSNLGQAEVSFEQQMVQQAVA